DRLAVLREIDGVGRCHTDQVAGDRAAVVEREGIPYRTARQVLDAGECGETVERTGILPGDCPGVRLVRAGQTIAAPDPVEPRGGDGGQAHGERRGLRGQLAEGRVAHGKVVVARGTGERDGVRIGAAVYLDGGYCERPETGRLPAGRVTD